MRKIEPARVTPTFRSQHEVVVRPWLARCRSTLAKWVFGLLNLAICLHQGAAVANEGTASARPPKPVAHNEEASIPVATDAGIAPMSQRDYNNYVKPMGHLPVMSKTYVFGHTIPLPKTDKFGHIHLPTATPAAPGNGQRR
jgi:hypothetical protein